MPESPDINCWNDAGPWTDRGALNCGSLLLRLNAVRKAVEERYRLFGGQPVPVVFMPMESIADRIAALTVDIQYLADHFVFADVLNGIYRRVTLSSPYCGDTVWTDLDATVPFSFSRSFAAGEGSGSGSRSLSFRIRDGIAVLSAGQTAMDSQLEESPVFLSFAPLDADAMFADFPLRYEFCRSVGDWLWSAYNALIRMSCPLRTAGLSVMLRKNASASSRSFKLYAGPGGSQAYRVPRDGALVFPGSAVTEESLWNMTVPATENEISAVTSRIVSDCTNRSENPFSGTCTLTDVYVRTWSGTFQNCCWIRGAALDMAPAQIRFRRCFTKRYLEQPYWNASHTENEWSDLVSAELGGG